MPKEAYLTMCINKQLKAELRGLAREEGCNLANFIENRLDELVPTCDRCQSNTIPRSRQHGTPLNLLFNAQLCAKLQKIAESDYRTLPDFVAMSLHQIAENCHIGVSKLALVATKSGRRPKSRFDAARTRIAVRLDPQLHAKLRQLAEDDCRNLTNFIEFKLHQLVATYDRSDTSRTPLARRRGPYLYVWLNTELRAKLRKLARENNLTLTDFAAMSLHQITKTCRVGKQPNSRRAAANTRITVRINPLLRGRLRKLAEDDYRSLTNFIELQLYQLIAMYEGTQINQDARRQQRDARLTMRVASEFKDNLQKLADLDYRSLTDFVEIKLHQIVANSRAKFDAEM